VPARGSARFAVAVSALGLGLGELGPVRWRQGAGMTEPSAKTSVGVLLTRIF
jgi:hypothetical protein